jgi:hypothetical protein
LSPDRIKSAMIVDLVCIKLGTRIGMSFPCAISCVAGVIVSMLMNGFHDSCHPPNVLSRSCKVGKDGISCNNTSFSCVASDGANVHNHLIR